MKKSAGIIVAPARITVRIYRRFPRPEAGELGVFGEIRISYDARENPAPMVFRATLDTSVTPPVVTFFTPIPSSVTRESEIGVDLYERSFEEYLSKKGLREA